MKEYKFKPCKNDNDEEYAFNPKMVLGRINTMADDRASKVDNGPNTTAFARMVNGVMDNNPENMIEYMDNSAGGREAERGKAFGGKEDS